MANLNYSGIVAPLAARYGVPPAWVYAFIGAESGDVHSFTYRDVGATWEPKAGQYSWGPMQILESTARMMGFSGSAADLDRPEVSIPFAVAYMRWLMDRWNITTFPALYSAYNSGNPEAWLSPGAVQSNVKRAQLWLAHFAPKGIGAAVALIAVGLGFWISKQKRWSYE